MSSFPGFRCREDSTGVYDLTPSSGCQTEVSSSADGGELRISVRVCRFDMYDNRSRRR